jgi:hypothetical protein
LSTSFFQYLEKVKSCEVLTNPSPISKEGRRFSTWKMWGVASLGAAFSIYGDIWDDDTAAETDLILEL